MPYRVFRKTFTPLPPTLSTTISVRPVKWSSRSYRRPSLILFAGFSLILSDQVDPALRALFHVHAERFEIIERIEVLDIVGGGFEIERLARPGHGLPPDQVAAGLGMARQGNRVDPAFVHARSQACRPAVTSVRSTRVSRYPRLRQRRDDPVQFLGDPRRS